jgi:hypothetical protein
MGSGFSTRSVMVPDPVAGIKPDRRTADRDGQPYLMPSRRQPLTPNRSRIPFAPGLHTRSGTPSLREAKPDPAFRPRVLQPSSPPALACCPPSLQPSLDRLSSGQLANRSTGQLCFPNRHPLTPNRPRVLFAPGLHTRSGTPSLREAKPDPAFRPLLRPTDQPINWDKLLEPDLPFTPFPICIAE